MEIKYLEIKNQSLQNMLQDINNDHNNVESNIKIMVKLFNKELCKLQNNKIQYIQHIEKIYSSISVLIAEFNFENISIELTSDETIKFTLIFSENKIIMLTKHIFPKNVGLDEDQIIYSLFINRKLILSNVLEIKKFIKGFKEFLFM